MPETSKPHGRRGCLAATALAAAAILGAPLLHSGLREEALFALAEHGPGALGSWAFARLNAPEASTATLLRLYTVTASDDDPAAVDISARLADRQEPEDFEAWFAAPPTDLRARQRRYDSLRIIDPVLRFDDDESYAETDAAIAEAFLARRADWLPAITADLASADRELAGRAWDAMQLALHKTILVDHPSIEPFGLRTHPGRHWRALFAPGPRRAALVGDPHIDPVSFLSDDHIGADFVLLFGERGLDAACEAIASKAPGEELACAAILGTFAVASEGASVALSEGALSAEDAELATRLIAKVDAARPLLQRQVSGMPAETGRPASVLVWAHHGGPLRAAELASLLSLFGRAAAEERPRIFGLIGQHLERSEASGWYDLRGALWMSACVEALESEDELLRSLALGAAGELGAVDWQVAAAALSAEHPRLRLESALVLDRLSAPEAEEALSGYLDALVPDILTLREEQERDWADSTSWRLDALVELLRRRRDSLPGALAQFEALREVSSSPGGVLSFDDEDPDLWRMLHALGPEGAALAEEWLGEPMMGKPE